MWNHWGMRSHRGAQSLRLALVLALAALLAPALEAPSTLVSSANAGNKASFTKRTYGVGPDARDYWVYSPARPARPRPPLVVYLHGCNQTATDAAIGTRWNALAEKHGFIVAYPEQRRPALVNGDTNGNGYGCWNWFEPAHQSRDAGDPATIAGITRAVMAASRADPSRVYLMGVSAGADMTAILGATYPDLFAAIAPFAGCAYLTCADVTGAAAYTAMGSRRRVVPALVGQGTADPLNNFAMGETMATQQVGTADLADDGATNGSVSRTPSRVDHVGFDASLLSGAGAVGDACVRARQFPCAGAVIGAKSYPYSIEHHTDRAGCSVVEFWIIHGLSHNYPGGDPRGSFTDSIGPDITTAAWTFFTRHRLGAAPCKAS